MAHQELERLFSLELLHTTRNALLSESQAQSWFRSSLVKVLEWSESCLSWQGEMIFITVLKPFLALFPIFHAFPSLLNVFFFTGNMLLLSFSWMKLTPLDHQDWKVDLEVRLCTEKRNNYIQQSPCLIDLLTHWTFLFMYWYTIQSTL